MSGKVFYYLLIFGVVVCQNGESNLAIEGSGSGDLDSGSTVNTTVITKVTTNGLEDVTDDFGSGGGKDLSVSKPSTPASTTAEFTMTTRPITIDVEDGSGSSIGSGEEPATDPPIVWITKGISTTRKEVKDIGGGDTAILRTTIDSKTAKKGSTIAPSYDVSSKEAETRKPSTTSKPIGTDPSTDIEVIYSPTSSPGRSTVKRSSTMANVIDDPTEDPSLIGNTAKSSGKRSQPAISFTTVIIIGVVVGALLAVLVILLLVYRLRKKDEGSYSLDEPITGYTKQEPGSPVSGKEYLA